MKYCLGIETLTALSRAESVIHEDGLNISKHMTDLVPGFDERGIDSVITVFISAHACKLLFSSS
ncbi:MAG TPA: hypothetical protein PLR22_09230 [Saprospiraceae bacterium]|nr:hypothetical protein [Saprospiraceae bacterium]